MKLINKNKFTSLQKSCQGMNNLMFLQEVKYNFGEKK